MTRFALNFRYESEARPEPFRLALDVTWNAKATGIFGPSGSGKTTLLEILLGLRPRERVDGSVRIGDRALFDTREGTWLPARARRFGWVPQDSALFPHLTVEGNLRFGDARAGSFDAVVGLLELSGLLGRRADLLSGGERQRVALGRSLLAPHDVLLLDEPLASLDATRRSSLLGYIEKIVDEAKVPVLYVSHDWQEIQRLCDHALLLDGGVLTSSGAPGNLR